MLPGIIIYKLVVNMLSYATTSLLWSNEVLGFSDKVHSQTPCPAGIKLFKFKFKFKFKYFISYTCMNSNVQINIIYKYNSECNRSRR